jgi:hypothetical protein
MSARLLALCCLAILDASLLGAGSKRSNIPRVVVYLAGDTAQPAGPVLQMRRELNVVMRSAGYRVDFLTRSSADRNVEDSPVVVVYLDGYCGLAAGHTSPAPKTGASLAFSYMADGRVLPFSRVNCGNLTRMIAPALAGETPVERDYLYGRAMARIVAHELYHVLVGSRVHGRAGITQPGFTVGNLLADGFRFETAAVAELAGAPGR